MAGQDEKKFLDQYQGNSGQCSSGQQGRAAQGRRKCPVTVSDSYIRQNKK